MRFRPMRRHAPQDTGGEPEGEPPGDGDAAPPPPADGEERLLVVEWAARHQVNSVMAERAAMYAGKRNEPITEAEFLEMLRRRDV